MKRRPGLHPLSGSAAGLGPDAHTLETEARLRRAWDFVVGPALADRTCLLSLRRGTLSVGCWDVGLIGPMRQAAEGAWPQVQERLLTALRVRAQSIQVLPCDPPQPHTPPPQPTKPALTFDQLLDKLQEAGTKPKPR